jgi:hypothetical protein
VGGALASVPQVLHSKSTSPTVKTTSNVEQRDCKFEVIESPRKEKGRIRE